MEALHYAPQPRGRGRPLESLDIGNTMLPGHDGVFSISYVPCLAWHAAQSVNGL